jgi:hypothetical protein
VFAAVLSLKKEVYPLDIDSENHKVPTYIASAPQCPSPRWNWDPPTPSPASECALPPEKKGGGAHLLVGEGVDESQFGRLETKLSTLSTLWPKQFRRVSQPEATFPTGSE